MEGLFDKFTVRKKSQPPDPSGARYFVLDYVHDELARIPARGYANCMRSMGFADYAQALLESIAGAEEAPALRAYEVERNDGKSKPDARYVVLSYVHHYPSRVALVMYASGCKETRPQLHQDIRRELDETLPAYRAYIESKNPKPKGRRGAKAMRRMGS